MKRITVLLALIPLFSVHAATPFASVALQPTLTLEGGDWALHHEGGSLLDNFFYTYAGGLAAGIKSGRQEYYLEYSWKNSHEEYGGESSRTEIEDSLHTYTRSMYLARLKDRRLRLGFRHTIATNSPNSVRSFLGCGASIGSTKRSDIARYYEYSNITTDSTYEHISDTSRLSITDRNSLKSLGWFIEIGSRFRIYQNLSAVISGQFHSILAEFEYSGWYDFTYWKYYVEPSLSLALRWDFRKD